MLRQTDAASPEAGEDVTISADQWRQITRDEMKKRHFADEFFFRESVFDLHQTFGPGWHQAIAPIGLMLVRPDAIACRQGEKIVSIMEDEGFRCVAATELTIDRLTARSLWYYQWNETTLVRSVVADLLNQAGPSLMLLVRDLLPSSSGLQGCTRLSWFKGPSAPEQRAPWQIRSKIAARNHIFCALHTSDEPVDLVRELGILLDGEERRRICQALQGSIDRAQPFSELRALIDKTQAAIPANPLNLDESWKRVERVARTCAMDREARSQLLRILARMAQREALSRSEMLLFLRALRGKVDLLDLLYPLSERIAVSRVGGSTAIASQTWKRWAVAPG